LWRVVVGYAILIVILCDRFSLVFLVLGTGSSACGVGDVVMTVVFMLAHFPSLLDNIVGVSVGVGVGLLLLSLALLLLLSTPFFAVVVGFVEIAGLVFSCRWL